MLRTILTILQVLSGFSIVALVLLQRGKGADAGAGFGAGASGTVFGARGATTGLSRMTAIFAVVFMLNSLCLTYLFQRDARAAPESLLDKVPTSSAAPAPEPAAPPVDANAVPVVPAAPAEQPAEKP
jgi:preprotein translocase subunit SecG